MEYSIEHLASLCGNSLEVDAAAAAGPPSADAVGSLGLVELALEDGEKAADPEQEVCGKEF